MYKLICSDLDGTLLVSGGKVDPLLRDAIKAYERAGGKFCVVTGRMTVGALPVCQALDLHGELVTYQGAIVSDIDSGKITYEKKIGYEKAAKIAEYIERNGWYCQTYYGDKFFTATPNDFSKIYAKISYTNFVKTDEKLYEYILQRKENVPKIIVMHDHAGISEILKKLREKFGLECLINTSNPQLIEILDRSVNKGNAVRALAEKYGIKREEVLCIGDSENDLTMVEYAGLGVCVADGSDLLKEKANLTVPVTCEQGAVRYVIEKIALKDRQ